MAGKYGKVKNGTADNTSKIEKLLTIAFNTQDDKKALSIVEQVLELDPKNAEALMIKADHIQDDVSRTDILLRAIDSLNEGNNDSDERDLLFLALNQRLAFTLFSLEKYDDALSVTRMLLECDIDNTAFGEDSGTIRALHYRILIEKRNWPEILAETMRDTNHDPAWAYARLLAAFMLSSGDYNDVYDSRKNKNICKQMFWDALIMAPDIPFYILGYFGEPDENESDRARREFNFALIFYDIMQISDGFFRWFSKGTVLFGLLSNRFGAEHENMIDVLESLDGLDEYEAMSSIMLESDDTAIIETLAAHGCPKINN